MEEKIITTDDIEPAKDVNRVPSGDEGAGEESLLSENGDIESVDIDLDRVREKTFNKELGDLVEKIRSHELVEEHEEAEEIPDIALSEMREDDLLLKYHNLFYRAVNLIGSAGINAGFNQFELSLNTMKDELEKHIDAEMKRLSFRCYSILKYDLEKKCYKAAVNHIEGIDESNIIIDPNEELWKNIYDNKKGLIIGSKAINNSVYLRKRFQPSGRPASGFSYFFASFRNLALDFFSGLERPAGRELPYRSLFPILIIRLDNEETRPDPVFCKIRDRLAVHFIFLARKLIMKTHAARTESHRDLYNVMDYNLKMFQRDSDGLCYIINCTAPLTKEILFVLKYLHIKLKETLSKRAVISRIAKHRFVVMLAKQEMRALNGVVADFNKFYSNIFALKEFKISTDNPLEMYSD